MVMKHLWAQRRTLWWRDATKITTNFGSEISRQAGAGSLCRLIKILMSRSGCDKIDKTSPSFRRLLFGSNVWVSFLGDRDYSKYGNTYKNHPKKPSRRMEWATFPFFCFSSWLSCLSVFGWQRHSKAKVFLDSWRRVSAFVWANHNDQMVEVTFNGGEK